MCSLLDVIFLVSLQVGADKNLLVKDHTHTFVNKGGDIGGMIICLIKIFPSQIGLCSVYRINNSILGEFFRTLIFNCRT